MKEDVTSKINLELEALQERMKDTIREEEVRGIEVVPIQRNALGEPPARTDAVTAERVAQHSRVQPEPRNER